MNRDYSVSFAQSLLKEYYLKPGGEVCSIERAEGHAIWSQNFIVTVLSRGGRKEAFLLKIRPEYGPGIIRRLEIVDECFRNGVKVAQIIRSREGMLCVTRDDFLLVVFRFYSGKGCGLTPREIFSIGENLARLNENLGKFEDVFSRSNLYNDLNAEELKEVGRRCKNSNTFTGKIARLCGDLPSLYHSINGKLLLNKDERQLVHLDLHPGNVVFKGGKVRAMLDYDFIVTAPKLQSLAFACDRFSQNIEGMVKFVEGYQKVDTTLSADFLGLVPTYIKREALCRISWILRSFLPRGDGRWNFELDRHLMILDRMERIENEFISRIREML